MLKKLILLLMIMPLSISASSLTAQQLNSLSAKGQRLDQVFAPGYINFTIPLSLFLPKGLNPAVEALRNHNRKAAAGAFAQEVKAHPEDWAAYVGYLQAVPDLWYILLPQYQQAATNRPSLENRFNLGLLEFYVSSGRIADGSTSEAINALEEASRQNLQNVFEKRRNPLVGFVIAERGDPAPVYEQMLRNSGGEAAYKTYKSAQAAGWGGQPPIPALSSRELQILAFIVRGIKASHSERGGRPETKVVDGRSVTSIKFSEYTPDQEKSIAYLSHWIERIEEAVQRK